MSACLRLVAIALLILAGCSCSAPRATRDGVLRGQVVALADGDTITVLDQDKVQHKIRLVGIDAPERKQPFGRRSTEHLSDLVFRKVVEVEWTKRDRYGRILGKVLVADPACTREPCGKVDANLAQVHAGFAWWYRQYAKDQPAEDRRAYSEAEEASREAKRGLWADPSATPPWQWRRAKKGTRKGARQPEASGRAAAP